MGADEVTKLGQITGVIPPPRDVPDTDLDATLGKVQ
jgi:hypothetical protein